MVIKITCTNCGKKLETPEEKAGTKGKCPACGEVFEVPGVAIDKQKANVQNPGKATLQDPGIKLGGYPENSLRGFGKFLEVLGIIGGIVLFVIAVL